MAGLPMYSTNANVPTGQPNVPTPNDPNWLTDLNSILTGAGDIYGLYNASQLNSKADTVYKQSNPFGAFRPYYGQQLLSLMQDPSSVSKLPGYQFLMDQGVQAIDRSAAAPGGKGLGSGGEQTDLMKYGQGLADQFYMQQVQLLAGLAGSGINPANPAQALQGVGGAAGSVGSSITGLINQGRNLYNTGSDIYKTVSGWFGGGSAASADQGILNAAASGGSVYDTATSLPNVISDVSSNVDLSGLFGSFSTAGGGAAGMEALTGGAISDAAIGSTLTDAATMGTGALTADLGGAAAGSELGAGGAALGVGAGAALAGGLIAAPIIAGLMTKPVELTGAYWNRLRGSIEQGKSGNATYDKYDPAGQQQQMAYQTITQMLQQGQHIPQDILAFYYSNPQLANYSAPTRTSGGGGGRAY